MTDYTTPSSSLADTVPTGGSKMEESLVANVSHRYCIILAQFVTFLFLISYAISIHIDFCIRHLSLPLFVFPGGTASLTSSATSRSPTAELEPEHSFSCYSGPHT